ncbi:MAG: redoxin domain-containing protein [Planctomycetales bacterium]
MKRGDLTWGLFAVCFGLCFLVPCSRANAEDQELSPAGVALRRLLEEYDQNRDPRAFAPKFFQLAKQHPEDPAAVDALAWIAANLRRKPESIQAIEALERGHLQSERLAEACRQVAGTLSPSAERLLQRALKESPHAKVQSQACYQLVGLLQEQERLARRLQEQPDQRPRAQQYYGKELTNRLFDLDFKKTERRKEDLFEKMLKSFADVPLAEGTMGELAEKSLFAIRRLSVGKVAPEIESEDIDGNKFKLGDYRGKVVLLSFWGHW